MSEYIPFENPTTEAAREHNCEALRQDVIGIKCVYAGSVNGRADTYFTPAEVDAAVPRGMVILSAEVYASGAMNIFVGLPGAQDAAGFIRYRA